MTCTHVSARHQGGTKYAARHTLPIPTSVHANGQGKIVYPDKRTCRRTSVIRRHITITIFVSCRLSISKQPSVISPSTVTTFSARRRALSIPTSARANRRDCPSRQANVPTDERRIAAQYLHCLRVQSAIYK